jgi:hypothetical protein
VKEEDYANGDGGYPEIETCRRIRLRFPAGTNIREFFSMVYVLDCESIWETKEDHERYKLAMSRFEKDHFV